MGYRNSAAVFLFVWILLTGSAFAEEVLGPPVVQRSADASVVSLQGELNSIKSEAAHLGAEPYFDEENWLPSLRWKDSARRHTSKEEKALASLKERYEALFDQTMAILAKKGE